VAVRPRRSRRGHQPLPIRRRHAEAGLDPPATSVMRGFVLRCDAGRPPQLTYLFQRLTSASPYIFGLGRCAWRWANTGNLSLAPPITSFLDHLESWHLGGGQRGRVGGEEPLDLGSL